MKEAKVYIGIDPGQAGGIALLGEDSVEVHKMPATEHDIWEIFAATWSLKYFALIEKVHSMPGQGVASTFKFGKGYGFLRGCLVAAGCPFDEVTPQKWQRGLDIPKRKTTETKTQFKNRLKQKAQQLYPTVDVTLATADAILIAHYAKNCRPAGGGGQ